VKPVAEIALAAAAAVLFAGAILTASGWEAATATFPVVIGIAGLGLAVWAVVADVLKARAAGAAPEAAPASAEDRARARGAFIWIGVFFAAVLLLGFEWGVGLAAAAFYRIEARLGWLAAACAGAVCGGFLYVAAQFLNIPLYAGLLLEAL